MNQKVKVLSLFIVLTGILLIHTDKISAQEYSIRGYGGALYYLGDLTPQNGPLSLSGYNPSLGISGGIKVSEVFTFHSKFIYGRLTGDDADSNNEGRRKRNLSFSSSLYELGLHTEININKWIRGLDKYGIKLYYTTGVNLFLFNPKAYYKGNFVALQPLGTEGQGNTVLNKNKKYKLTQFSIPFGIGVKFNMSNRVLMGFEVTPRWTFTDYLDDVSGTYIAYNELASTNGMLAADLSNRTGEYLGTTPVTVETGTLRGDPNNTDWYLFMGLYVSYRWGEINKIEDEVPEVDILMDK